MKTVRILVVDDDSAIRTLLKEYFGHCGFEVMTARDGHEALALYAENKAEIDLVTLDYEMPGMNGLECFESLLALNDTVKAVVISGILTDELGSVLKSAGVAACFRKPFNLSSLGYHVGEIARGIPHSFVN